MEISDAYGKVLELEGLLLLLKSGDEDSLKIDRIFSQAFGKIDEIGAVLETAYQRHGLRSPSCRRIDNVGMADAEGEKIADNAVFEETADAGEDAAETPICQDNDNSISLEIEAESGSGCQEHASFSASCGAPQESLEIESLSHSDADETAFTPEEPANEKKTEIMIDESGADVNKSAFAFRTNGNIRKAFTLNDNYKFRRQLFSNSQDSYNAALSQIESMKSAHDAEDYFYGALGWDRENADVKEFMSIVSAYFWGK